MIHDRRLTRLDANRVKIENSHGIDAVLYANDQVPVETAAVTELLARFVTEHPSRGWNDAVELEAHRTFANWVGCAIRGSEHPAVAVAAKQ